MKRTEALELKEQISSKGFYSAIVFYVSPVNDVIEERHIYADANSECLKWLEDIESLYKSDIFKAFVTYSNGQLRYQKGNISKFFN